MDTSQAIVTAVALLLLAAVLCTPAACTVHRHAQVAEAIKAGADPLEAKCAIEGDTERSPVCLVLAARKENRQ